MDIKHTGEFDLAYRFVNETNQNIFLTGKAGTGKTTFLKYLQKNSIKKSVVAAPTGVAAINAHGVTLHSLFQLPFGIILPEFNIQGSGGKIKNHPLLSKIHYNQEKINLLQNLELLIIDEASMVASYTVDAIDTILRYIRRRPYEIFGGVQILFIGDLYQLPPVVKREEWEILKEYYSSIFFFDSKCLRDNVPVIIELKKIFRQRDGRFIDILNGIRDNDISEENFRILNGRIKANFTPENNAEYIILTTHNFQSDEINQRRLNNLSKRNHTYEAEIRDNFPENAFPAEKELNLKAGAQVMFLKNDTEGRKYFNGKIGIVTRLNDECIRVKCKGEAEEIDVKKCEWQNINYKINPDTREITEEVLGSFIQYPLRLAWAITIHKSQGLTFDKVIIDAERAFTTGQVYVALSRCTSLEGLVLKTPVHRNFLGAHKDFKDWQDKNHSTDLSNQLNTSRQRYILQEIQNIFTWKSLYYNLKDLEQFFLENQDKIDIKSIMWIETLKSKEKELYEVSDKFKQMLSKISSKSESVEENAMLQQRLKDGANYFNGELMKWEERLLDHPLAVGTKKLSKRIDSCLEEIINNLEEIQQKIDYCRSGFSLNKYLLHRKFFTGKHKKVKTSYSRDLVVKGNTVLETVQYLKNGKSVEQIAGIRNLVEGTIESHLVKAIKQDLIQIEEILPDKEFREIIKYFPEDIEDIRLTPIKEKVPPEITYGKLRMVLAWLEKEKK